MDKKSDNDAMKPYFHRTIAYSTSYGPSIGGRQLWTIDKVVGSYDTCLPVSALSVVLHRFPNTSLKNDLLKTFEEFKAAYEQRSSLYLFDPVVVKKHGLVEISNFPSPILDLSKALDPTFKWIQTRHHFLGIGPIGIKTPIKNTAFILVLRRPDEKSSHAITITCDGLWMSDGGFGFQDTQYEQGRPVRYSREFATRDAFNQAFSEYLHDNRYSNATLQAICLEDCYSKLNLFRK